MTLPSRGLLDFSNPAARVAAEQSTWLESTIERLNRLLRLPDNWDREGASRVRPEAAIAALEILGATARRDTPAPSIVPTEEGGVQLEWHMRGIDLEVEVAPSGRIRGFLADSADDSETGPRMCTDGRRAS